MPKGRHRSMLKPRIDANQPEIVKALKKAGCYVESFGPVDLLVANNGLWYVLEVKDGAKPAHKRKLTKNEIQWILDCRNRAPIHPVKSVEEALSVVGANKAEEE